jgi:hypothetical protein
VANLTLKPFLELLSIQTKAATFERFDYDGEFAWAQREFIAEIERQYREGKPVRIIVLKARQLGLSTVTSMVFFWWAFIHNNIYAMLISKDRTSSASIFEKIQGFWSSFPFRRLYTTTRNSAQRISWANTNSSLRTASARNLDAGRGETVHCLHGSEVAFWPDPQGLMTGLSKTIPNLPGTIVILESTANGVGNWFHKMWTDAVSGRNDYVPLFFPWWRHYEYRRDTDLTMEDLDPYEIELVNMGAPLEAIAWRRWAIPNLCNHDERQFRQEYPATPDEAFLTTGENVFPLEKLNRIYEDESGVRGFLVDNGGDIVFVEDQFGPLTIYKRPMAKQEYFVGADPARVAGKGDPCCAQIINRRSLEQVAVYHRNVDAIEFAKDLIKIGKFFNEAVLCPETEGPGYAVIGYLRDRYDNIWHHVWADKHQGRPAAALGWSTNWKRKTWAIEQLIYLMGEEAILIHDYLTYAQLQDYVVKANGEYEGQSLHDDAVMALAIAYIASLFGDPISPYGRRLQPLINDTYNEAPWDAFKGVG